MQGGLMPPTFTFQPENVVLPAITGTPEIGQTLSVSTGTWNDPSVSYAYQWKRDNVAIGGATNNTYIIPSTTGGLSCTVTATNAAGSTSVRASSGEPRQLWLCGDSLTTVTGYTAAIQDALDDEFGAGAWEVFNVAHSGDDVAAMETLAQAQVDPNVHKGHGVVFFHEYANQVSGIQGSSTGSETADLLFAFGEARFAAGGLPLYCTSPYNGAQTGGHNGAQAHVASEAVRAGFDDHRGLGLVDFDDATLLSAINANDGVHWTATELTLIATKTVEGIVAAAITGGCGDIEINEPVFTNLRTYDNPTYVYDPVNPLPHPAVATQLEVTAGAGWDLVTHTITGSIPDFPTADGPQTLYSLTPAQSNANLSGGTYELT